MYDSYDLAISIKTIAKEKNKVIKEMLKTCELSSNTMSSLYHGKSIAFDSVAKIADYLEVSVDYLLGRTDEPEIKSISGSINNSSTVIGHNNKVSGNNIAYNVPKHNDNFDRQFDNSIYYELLSYLETLSSSQRRHALADILDILEENYPL